MKKIRGLVAVLLLVSVLGAAGCRAGTEGQADPEGDPVAATYKGEPIRKSVVAEQKKEAGEAVSDREIIDRIITNLIMLE